MSNSPSNNNAIDLIKGVVSSTLDQKWYILAEHAVSLTAIILATNYVRKNGIKKISSNILGGLLNAIPGANSTINQQIESEVDKAVTNLFKPIDGIPDFRKIPRKGLSADELSAIMQVLKDNDVNPDNGKVFAYAYSAQGNHEEKLERAFTMFMQENALSPMAFPSLRKFEKDILTMATELFHGDEQVRGTMTSGGTESILMAIKVYRDRAKETRGIIDPEIVLPATAHPAFFKAAHYFQVKTVTARLNEDLRVDIQDMRSKISKNTILLIGSAPQYPHGIIDPIQDIAQLAKEFHLPLHVDACIGGFLLPFLEKLNDPRWKIPLWDFRIPEVTSISADIHKYGYTLKGASVVLYRNDELRRYQFFSMTSWPGGLFVSPSMLGTRSGGAIAAAWASLVGMGEEGFLERTRTIMETAEFLKKEIASMDGMKIMGKPDMSIVAFTSTKWNIHAICDQMENVYGWHMERQQLPDCVHMTLMPPHFAVKEKFIENLKQSISTVESNPNLASEGNAAMYGMVAKIPVPELIDNFLTTFMSKVYS